MRFYTVVVATMAHSHAVFTYQSEEIVSPGTFVRVPLGRQSANGVVLKEVKKPTFKTRNIEKILHKDEHLPEELQKLAEWISTYYVAHLGLVYQSMLPPGLHKSRRDALNKQSVTPSRVKKDITLTNQQKKALEDIVQSEESAFLLHGVPGSGKTQVYIEACRATIAQGKSAIILVPEIALTAQLVAEFSQHFAHTAVMHSTMTEAERHTTWLKILTSEAPMVVIGPRSALFSPLKNIGLIVVDECHEQSYKQDRSPRYHAIYAARTLAKLHRAKIVLGSATPGVAELYLAKMGRIKLLSMPKAIQEQLNDTKILSHKDRTAFSRHRFISNDLIESIEYSLSKKEQALIFHNRRGTAPSVLCEQCGWQATCPHCDLPLTFHADHMQLLCHTCNFSMPVPHVCPACGAPAILFKGIGTKLIAAELAKLFPHAKIARFDADNSKTEQVQSRYQELYEGKVDILVGTQIIAKGLDLPRVSTVGILQADAGLHLPDFTANERTFQLLYQASGRAGRENTPGRVIIQTYLPDNQLIMQAAERDFAAFYAVELSHRKKGHYPPFTYLLKLNYGAVKEESAIRAAKRLAQELRRTYPQVTILGPTPAFHEQLRGKYYWQLVLKSAHRIQLQTIAQNLPNNWQFDIDPVGLL